MQKIISEAKGILHHHHHGSSSDQPQQPQQPQQPLQPAGGSSGQMVDNMPRVTYPQPGQAPPGPGVLPPKVANLKYHEAMRFYHPRGHQHDTLRDLGFSGVLDGKIVWTWGDTLMGTEEHNMICATDSTTIGNPMDRMASIDTGLWPNSDNVRNFIPPNEYEQQHGGLGEWSYGGTNIVEIGPGQGLIFYLLNHRPGGQGKIVGAGVATVRMGPGHVPEATRCGSTLWTEFEPYYGDVGICLDPRERMIYAWGHGPQQGDKEVDSRTFLCRAPADQATNVDAYEYWLNDTKQWTRQRLTSHGQNGTIKINQNQAAFTWYQMNQANPFWSNYFNTWMFLYGDCFGSSDVKCMTADKLEGPWADHGVVASSKTPGVPEDGFRYCQTGHPEFDPTGKTVLATWTRNNVIWGVTIEWA